MILGVKKITLSRLLPCSFWAVCFPVCPFSTCPSKLQTRGFMSTAPFKLQNPLWVVSFLYRYFSKTCCCQRPKRMGHHKRSPQGEWSRREGTFQLLVTVIHRLDWELHVIMICRSANRKSLPQIINLCQTFILFISPRSKCGSNK